MRDSSESDDCFEKFDNGHSVRADAWLTWNYSHPPHLKILYRRRFAILIQHNSVSIGFLEISLTFSIGRNLLTKRTRKKNLYSPLESKLTLLLCIWYNKIETHSFFGPIQVEFDLSIVWLNLMFTLNRCPYSSNVYCIMRIANFKLPLDFICNRSAKSVKKVI